MGGGGGGVNPILKPDGGSVNLLKIKINNRKTIFQIISRHVPDTRRETFRRTRSPLPSFRPSISHGRLDPQKS